jgi:hypothetical protein
MLISFSTEDLAEIFSFWSFCFDFEVFSLVVARGFSDGSLADFDLKTSETTSKIEK